MLKLPPNPTKLDFIGLGGGLDELTPTLQIKPGRVRQALNWEQSVTGGYTRIAGYERTDGRPSPAQAIYLAVTVNITGALAVGNTITGATSGATGVVISIDGSLVVYTKAAGSFGLENITVGGTVRGNITDLASFGGTDPWDVTQRALAADVYRADILAVPGSGRIRGVHYFDGVLYAWRDNAGATALVCFKWSSSGWVSVPLLYELAFTAGTSEYAEGETVTQGGVTATVKRVVLDSGGWATSDAAGRLIVTAPSGGAFAAGASAGGGAATLSGNATAITMLPGGRIEISEGNFGAGARMYGCDGVNRGFEFDGTVLVPINSGMVPDKPQHVLAHVDHLWFSVDDQLRNSGIGAPHDWTSTAGAAEYAMQADVTALVSAQGATLHVMMVGKIDVIYGTSAADFRREPFEDNGGGKAYSAQRINGQTVVFDDGGVFALSATQAYGNFSTASMTMMLRPWTQTRRNLVTASMTNREKSQYRVFFSDGSALYCTIVNGKAVGVMPMQFPHAVRCACHGETPDGAETSFFGSDNGMVYRLDAGTSFDGGAIDHFMLLPFTAQGNARQRKRYRKASFEVQGGTYCEFSVTWDIGYGVDTIPQGAIAQVTSAYLASAFWDQGGWDLLTWDGRTLTPSEIEIAGTAENIALRIAGTDARFSSFTLPSVVLHYIPRRALR